jgi:single-stranded-DNA-specific exonuclease
VVCLARDGLTVAPTGRDERIYLDLAAIGTIGDVGSLHGLNRAIVREGVEILRATRRQGLRALARQTTVDLATTTAESISFKITPKLNAPGRMGSPDIALRLLLATDMDSAEELAREVIACDGERRTRAELVLAEASATLAQEETISPVIVLAGDNWPSGVLGPVAAKVAERYGRPAVILAGPGDHLGGSGRSVADWDLAAALHEIGHLLERHGGHSRAAGLTLDRSRIDDVRSALSALFLTSGIVFPAASEIQIEADLGTDMISVDLARAIEWLGPFGAGNERPVLRWRNAGISRWERVGKDKSHAQLWLGNEKQLVRAIYFGGAQTMEQTESGQRIDALIELSLGVWRNSERVDARVIDIQPVV